MRHTRSHTANRRSHHALKSVSFAVCANCGAKKMKHMACADCGKYKNREVIDMVGKLARKTAKQKEKAKEQSK
jgi:large subunit ribosomal protein L32